MPPNLASSSSVALAAFGMLATGCASAHYGTRAAHAPAAAEGPSPHAVVVVRVPSPRYAPRFVIRGKFRGALSEYEAIAPLEAKYFTIGDDGQFGGMYLWRTRADAERHFDAAWHAKVRQRRGVDGDVLVMDAPYVVDGPAALDGEPQGARSLGYPAWASLVRWELGAAASVAAAAHGLAQAAWSGPALVRGFVVTGPSWVGVAALWATREGATEAVGDGARAAIGARMGATGSSALLFEAPLLIDATLRASR